MQSKRFISLTLAALMTISQLTPTIAAQEDIYETANYVMSGEADVQDADGQYEISDFTRNSDMDSLEVPDEAIEAGGQRNVSSDDSNSIEENFESQEIVVDGAEDATDAQVNIENFSNIQTNSTKTVSMDDVFLNVKKSASIKIKDIKGKEKKSLKWTSSEPKVASVSGKGKVKALERGITYISAFYPEKNMQYVTKVVVNKPELTEKKVTLTVGEDYWVALTGILSEKVKWTTKKEKAAQLINDTGSAHFIAREKGVQKYTAVVNGKKYKVSVKVKEGTAPKNDLKYIEKILYPATVTAKGEKLYTASNGSAYSMYYTISSNGVEEEDEETIDPSKQYKVKFNLNHPSGFYVIQDVVNGKVLLPSLSSFDGAEAPKGYVFVGWTTIKNSVDSLYTPGQVIKVKEDTEFYGVWKLADYRITYLLTEGTNHVENPSTYNVNTPTIVLKDASKKGCKFEGWYTGDSFIQKIEKINTADCKDIILYAKYSQTSTSTISSNKATNNNDNGKINVLISGITIDYPVKPSSDLKPEDYAISQDVHANVNENIVKPHGSRPYAWVPKDVSVNDITSWSDLPDFTATANGLYYLYIKTEEGIIKAAEVTVNNIDDESPAISVQTEGQDAKIDVSDGRSGVNKLEVITPSGNIITVPHTDIKADGTVELNGLLNEHGTYIIKVYDEAGNETAYYYTYVIVNETDPSKDEPKSVDESKKKTETFEEKYTIKYHSNPPTGSDTVVEKVTNANKYKFAYPDDLSIIPVAGYEFTGWGSSRTDGNVDYPAGRYYDITSDKELYAVWKPLKYSIFYKLNGGSNNKANPSEYLASDPDVTLHNPSLYGNNFEGWFSDSEYSKSISSIDTALCKDITVYAKWKANTFDVTKEEGYAGTYDGKAHSITVETSTPGAQIFYKTDSGEYSTTNPSFVNVGTYKVSYKIIKDNYVDYTGEKNVNIIFAKSSMTKPTGKTLTYNENSQTLINAGSAVGGTIQYGIGSSTTSAPTSWSSSLPTATNVGTYYIWARVVGDINHSNVTASYACTTTINKATLGTINASNATKTYTGSAQYLSAVTCSTTGTTIIYGTSSGSYPYTSITNSNLGITNVGTKTVYYKVSKAGYNDKTGSYTLTITKANATMVKPTPKTDLIYNGKSQVLVNAGSATGGVLYYARWTSPITAPSNSAWSTDLPYGFEDIEYYIWVKVIGDNNHNDIAPTYACSVEISEEPFSGTAVVWKTSGGNDSGTTLQSGTTSQQYALLGEKGATKKNIELCEHHIKNTGAWEWTFDSRSDGDSIAFYGETSNMYNNTKEISISFENVSSGTLNYTYGTGTAMPNSNNWEQKTGSIAKGAKGTVKMSLNSNGCWWFTIDCKGSSKEFPIGLVISNNPGHSSN